MTSLLLQKIKTSEASDLQKYSERVARRKFAAFASKRYQSDWL
jgi:hypothetical protein